MGKAWDYFNKKMSGGYSEDDEEDYSPSYTGMSATEYANSKIANSYNDSGRETYVPATTSYEPQKMTNEMNAFERDLFNQGYSLSEIDRVFGRTKSEPKEEKSYTDRLKEIITQDMRGNGFKDEAINQITSQVKDNTNTRDYEALRSNADFNSNSDYRSSVVDLEDGDYKFNDMTHDYINKENRAVNFMNTNGMAFNKDISLAQMDDDEIRMYNYLYNTEGKKSAMDYVESIRKSLNEDEAEKQNAYWKEAGQKNPIASSMISALVKPTQSLEYIGQALDYLGDGQTDQNNPIFSRSTQLSNSVTEGVTEDMGALGKFLYSTGMSMIDFGLNTALMGGLGGAKFAAKATPILMGGSAASSTYQDAKSRGLNDSDAIGLGALAGIAEAVFEHFSVETLLKPNVARDSIAKYIAKNFAIEGSEEVATDIANFIADDLIAGDLSQYNITKQNYINEFIEQGYSEEEAERMAQKQTIEDFIFQMGEDFLGGAISGGVMGAGGSVVMNANASRYAKQNGLSGMSKENQMEMLTDALEMSEKSDANAYAKRMTKTLEKGKGLSDSQIGFQAQFNDAEMLRQIEPDLAKLRQIADEMANTKAKQNEAIDSVGSEGAKVMESFGDLTDTQKTQLKTVYNNAILGKSIENIVTDELTKEQINAMTKAAILDERSLDNGESGIYDSEERNSNKKATEFKEINSKAYDSGISQISLGETTSTKALGISSGTDLKSLRIVTGNYTEAMKKGAALARSKGYNLTYVVGQIETSDVGDANALVEGNNVIVSCDRTMYDAYQLIRHEDGHKMIARGEIDVQKIKDDVRKRFKSEEEFDYLLNQYVEAYKNCNMTEEEVIEEIICDALGEMNLFKVYNQEIADDNEQMLEEVRKSVERNRQNPNKAPPMSKAKMSINIRNLAQKMFGSKKLYTDKQLKKAQNVSYSIVAAPEIKSAEEKVLNLEAKKDHSEFVRKLSARELAQLKDYVSTANDLIQKLTNLMVKPEFMNGNISTDSENFLKEEFAKNMPDDIPGETIKENDSYSKTIENSLMCVRSLITDYYLNIISERIGRPLTINEQIASGKALAEITGDERECMYCYVMMDRAYYRELFINYFDQYERLLEKVKENKDGYRKSLEWKKGKDLMNKYNKKAKGENPKATVVKKENPLFADFLKGKSGMREASPNMWNRYVNFVNEALNGTKQIKLEYLSTENTRQKASEISDYLAWAMHDAHEYSRSSAQPVKNKRDVEIDGKKYQLSYVSYNGSILNMKDEAIGKLNKEYGLRMYSYSDYTPQLLIENMQMIIDASIRGLKILAYTKSTDFVRIFAPTNALINMSTYGTIVNREAYENDEALNKAREEYKAAYKKASETKDNHDIANEKRSVYLELLNPYVQEDGMQGINWDEAKSLRDEFDNTSVIFVADSEDVVEWSMAQDWIDCVIPFHTVRTSGEQFITEYNFDNFKTTGSDKKINSWKDMSKEWKENHKTSISPVMHKNDKGLYLKKLADNHLTPRFPQFIDNPNYMKLVNETRLRYDKAMPVVPIFNEELCVKEIEKIPNKPYDVMQSGNSVANAVNELAEDEAKNISSGVKASRNITPQEEKQYEDAYWDGDDEEMQRILDKVANKLGYKYKAYHHTENSFTVFDLSKSRRSMDIQGFFFSADPDAEAEYGSVRYDVYLKMSKPYVIDSSEKANAIPVKFGTDDYGIKVREWLQDNGYDSVIRKADYYGSLADEYIVFDSTQIKSAEPMTFSDDEYGEGEYIPLGERFNENNPDIRYSRNVEQEYSSEDTSRPQVPATFSQIALNPDDRVLDWGGGQYDITKDAIEEAYPGIKFEVVDKYNRTPTHNNRILDEYTEDKADVLTINNVLNVIKEDAVIVEDVLEESKRYLSDDGICYIKVYEKNGNGIGEETSKGYQRNEKASDYIPLIQEVYKYVEKYKGDILIASDKPIDRSKILPTSDDNKELFKNATLEGRKNAISMRNVKYSRSFDSEGNRLTENQEEYFKDSKVRDENGRLMVVYHMSSNDFTVFDRKKARGSGLYGSGFYFANSPQSGYGQFKYSGYLNLVNPLTTDGKKTTKSQIKNFVQYLADNEDDYGLYNFGYGATVDSVTNELWKHSTDWYMFNDLNTTAFGDLAKMLREFNNVNGTDYDGIIAPSEIVAMESNQFKNIDNINPTDNDDIRFSRNISSLEEIAADNRQLKRDLSKAKTEIEKQKADKKLTSRISVKESSAKTIAQDLIKTVESNASVLEVRDAIKELGEMIYNDANSETFADDVKAKAIEISSDIINRVNLFKDDTSAKEIRKALKTGIKVSDISKWSDYEKSLLGKYVKESGRSISEVYNELYDKYGYMVKDGQTSEETEMLKQILEMADESNSLYANPYIEDGLIYSDTIETFANFIIEETLDVKVNGPTFADRKKTEKNNAVAKEKAKAKEKIEALKQKRKDDLQTQKTYYKNKEAKASEKRKCRMYKEKIAKHCRGLDQKLRNGNDKNHIPEEFKLSVAAVLNAINLESSFDYDENGKRTKKGTGTPTKKTQAFEKLRKEYEKILNDQTLVTDPDMIGENGMLDEIMSMEFDLNKMNSTQLEKVYRMVLSLEATISNANKIFAKSRWESVDEFANAIRQENADKDLKKLFNGRAGNFANKLFINNLTPEGFFRRLGSSGEAVFKILRDAQDKSIVMLKDIANDTQRMFDSNTAKANDEQKIEVILGGEKVELSASQLMELYVLNKREQARKHLSVGGIMPKGEKSKGIFKNYHAETYKNIAPEELTRAFGKLSEEQIALADKLQNYLSTTISDYGNEASMRVYGYRKFLEDNYWPIRSYKAMMNQEIGKDYNAPTSVKNKGMSRPTIPEANNPIVLGSIFDTFDNHISDMVNYAAYLEATEDVNRLRNYTFGLFDDNGHFIPRGKMAEIFTRVYGENYGINYLADLLKDVSNTRQSEEMYFGGLMGAYKVSSVALNIRVILQQPTAILRAMEEINPKYLSKGLVKPFTGWEEAKEISPIAQWKDWGYFDVNTGKKVADILHENKSKLSRAKELSMKPAGMADSFGWGILWNACKSEAKDNGYTEGTEEFNEYVKGRFEQIINRTQVVDGVLQRSAIMRSKSALDKMATAFLSEPTKQYNMFVNAIYDLRYGKDKEKASKYLGRCIMALLTSGIVNAVAQSIVDAMRSDDKDKKYWERFAEKLTGISGDEESASEFMKNAFNSNIGNVVDIFSYMPYVKDIESIIQGYSVDRMDLSTLENVWKSGTDFINTLKGDSQKSKISASLNLIAETSRFFGLPIATVKRDLIGLINTINVEADNYAAEYELQKALYNLNNTSVLPKMESILYKAYLNDKDAYEYIYRDLVDEGIDEDKIVKYINSHLKKDGIDERVLDIDSDAEYQEMVEVIKSQSYYKDAPENVKDSALDKAKSFASGEEVKDYNQYKDKGISEEEYILYDLAYDIVTEKYKDTKAADRRTMAIEMMNGLTREDKYNLWQGNRKETKNNPYK